MIVLSHSIPFESSAHMASAINLNRVSAEPQRFFILLFYNMGQIGNDIFLVCSAWFLVDKDSVSLEKVARLVGDCFTVSMLMLGFFRLIGYPLPLRIIVKQFIPVTMSNSWFLTAYLLLYIIHSMLNMAIKKMEKQQLLLSNTMFILLYCVMSFLMKGKLYFYNRFVGFIGVYFIVAYIKRYMNETIKSNKVGRGLLIIGIIGWIAQNIVTMLLGLHVSMFSRQATRWNLFINPCFILIGIGAFILANNRQFYNKMINYLSGLSLLIYMFHCNRIIRDYIRFDYFTYVKRTYTYKNVLVWVLIYAGISLVGGTLLAIVYHHTLQPLVHRMFIFLANKSSRLYKRYEKVLIRLN